MTPDAFEVALLRDGYTADARVIAPGHATPQHTHPFHVRGLVLEGDITLSTAEGSRTYRPGEVFTMQAGCPHAETIGPNGVRNLVGRLYPATA
jgi:quercetin dioxygenase-like cupin family protein